MRPFFFATCAIVVALLLFAAPLDARGGKGGGGGGRGRGNSGGGQGGGGPKWNRQSSIPSGGSPRNATHGQKPSHREDKHQLADKPHPAGKDKEKEKEKHSRTSPNTDSGNGTTEPYNKKEKQLAIEQRNRDKHIAQAQHLREIGERNGNQNLLDNADRMEAFARDHYARRVSHLEKFGVTDPLLNPGTGVTDPLLPGTDGLIDPLSNLEAFDRLPLLP